MCGCGHSIPFYPSILLNKDVPGPQLRTTLVASLILDVISFFFHLVCISKSHIGSISGADSFLWFKSNLSECQPHGCQSFARQLSIRYHETRLSYAQALLKQTSTCCHALLDQIQIIHRTLHACSSRPQSSITHAHTCPNCLK